MDIYIDLVVVLKLFSYKCLIDVFRSTDKDYTDKHEYFLFNKGDPRQGFAVAFNDTEYHIMTVLPPSAKLGFIYAKALKIADFFPWHIVTQLKDVYNLEDSLKTYMLKTSLYFCVFYVIHVCPKNLMERLPLQWTYFIYKHLEKRIRSCSLPARGATVRGG